MAKMLGGGGHAAVVLNECGDCKVVAIGSNRIRKKVVEIECAGQTDWDRACSPLSFTSVDAQVGEGCMTLVGAIIAARAKVGRHCIINHGAIVDHDCELGDYVHVSPGAKLLGGVKLGEGAWIGAGAVVLVGAVVPPWAIVRANSVFPNDYRIDPAYNGGRAGGRILKFQAEAKT